LKATQGWRVCLLVPQSIQQKWPFLPLQIINLLLMLLAGVLIRLGMLLGWFYAPDSITTTQICSATSDGVLSGLSIIISMFYIENLVLFTFNMIPLPPLDGSEVITLFFKSDHIDSYRKLIHHPGASLIGLLFAWHFFDKIFNVVYTVSLNILYLPFSFFRHLSPQLPRYFE
jgi:Zn-dependent protease